MILATHAVAGAALATVIPEHPGLAFVAGFLSHFLLDAIPHWDYNLSSNWKGGGSFSYFDLIKIGSDALLGLALGWWLFGPYALIGAIGAMLPDAFQFLYFKIRGPILTPLQTFHQWIHTAYRLDGRPVLGIVTQILLIGVIVLFTNALQ